MDKAQGFTELIKAAGFITLHGKAKTPGLIAGQFPHKTEDKTELDCPHRVLTDQQVRDRYGDGDLSNLLDHWRRNPRDRHSATIISWLVGEECWYAIAYESSLCVDICLSKTVEWPSDVSYLRSKSRGSRLAA